MQKNIILVGFMGTGKSSVGRRLAERLQMDFYDQDCEMQCVTGMDLMTLYWKYGEIRFRSEEELMLQKLLKRKNSVIATGGTLQMLPERLDCIRQSGTLICLKADLEQIQKRIARKDNRPLLRKKCQVTLEQLYENQMRWERVADMIITTDNRLFTEIVDEICRRLGCDAYGIL